MKRVSWVNFRARVKEGSAMTRMSAMMATTIMISSKVKPEFLFISSGEVGKSPCVKSRRRAAGSCRMQILRSWRAELLRRDRRRRGKFRRQTSDQLMDERLALLVRFLAELFLDLPALLAVALDELLAALAVELQAGFLDRRFDFLLHEFLPHFFAVEQRLFFFRREVRPAPEFLLKSLPLLRRQRLQRAADIFKLGRRRALERRLVSATQPRTWLFFCRRRGRWSLAESRCAGRPQGERDQ